MAKGKGGKKSGKSKTVINLNDFAAQTQADTNTRQVITAKPDLDWTLEDPTEAIQYEHMNLPSAPRLQRKNYDPSRVPDSPNYFIKISGLAYDVDEEQIRGFFNIIEDNEIVEIRIPKGGDSGDDRYNGEAFMEVNTLDALSVVLSKDSESFSSASGSRNRLTIEYRDRYGSWAQNPNQTDRGRYGDRNNRDNKRGGRGGGNDRYPNRDDETGGNWRDGPKRSSNNFNSFDRNDRNRDRDDFSRGPRNDEPPRQRKGLNLKKRTEPAPEGAVLAKDIKEQERAKPVVENNSPKKEEVAAAPAKPKSDPFGGAKACDENKIREAERRAEEKLNNMQRSFDENDSGRRDQGGYGRDHRDGDRNRSYNSYDQNRSNSRDDYNDRRGSFERNDRYRDDRRDDYRDNRDNYNRDYRDNRRDDYRDNRQNDYRDNRDRDNRRDDYMDRQNSYNSGSNNNNDDQPRERKKLNLKKRAEGENPAKDAANTESPQSNVKSNPFGAAKPADADLQRKRELEIEERRKKEMEEAANNNERKESRDSSGRKILHLKSRNQNSNDGEVEPKKGGRREPQEPRPMPQFKEKRVNIEVKQSAFQALAIESGEEDSEEKSQEEEETEETEE